MNHADHVNLLRPALLPAGGVWADLGAGRGAFTLALRELTGPEATIYAVDKDDRSLRELGSAYARRYGAGGKLRLVKRDFSASADLPPLDGILMANSLHFFRHKEPLLRRLGGLLRPGGILLIVEYNVDTGNPWVPYPISFEEFAELAARSGFGEPRLLARRPSSFLKEFYSARADAV